MYSVVSFASVTTMLEEAGPSDCHCGKVSSENDIPVGELDARSLPRKPFHLSNAGFCAYKRQQSATCRKVKQHDLNTEFILISEIVGTNNY